MDQNLAQIRPNSHNIGSNFQKKTLKVFFSIQISTDFYT